MANRCSRVVASKFNELDIHQPGRYAASTGTYSCVHCLLSQHLSHNLGPFLWWRTYIIIVEDIRRAQECNYLGEGVVMLRDLCRGIIYLLQNVRE